MWFYLWNTFRSQLFAKPNCKTMQNNLYTVFKVAYSLSELGLEQRIWLDIAVG